MPATPEELRLIKEKFADVIIGFQQGRIDLPDALVQIRDFEIPSEIPAPPGTPEPPAQADPPADGESGEVESSDPAADPVAGDETPQPDQEALAQAQAELDEALATALSHLR